MLFFCDYFNYFNFRYSYTMKELLLFFYLSLTNLTSLTNCVTGVNNKISFFQPLERINFPRGILKQYFM